jgi:hypothetical protein
MPTDLTQARAAAAEALRLAEPGDSHVYLVRIVGIRPFRRCAHALHSTTTLLAFDTAADAKEFILGTNGGLESHEIVKFSRADASLASTVLALCDRTDELQKDVDCLAALLRAAVAERDELQKDISRLTEALKQLRPKGT